MSGYSGYEMAVKELEDWLADLRAKLAQAERERDAAMKVVLGLEDDNLPWSAAEPYMELRDDFPHLFSKEATDGK